MKIKWQWFLGGQTMFWIASILLLVLVFSIVVTYVIDPITSIYMKVQSVDETSIKEMSESYVKSLGINISKPISYRFVKYQHEDGFKVRKSDPETVLLGTFHEWNNCYYIDISVNLYHMNMLHEIVKHETRHMIVQELKNEDGEWYKLCYTKTHECKIADGKVYDWKLHGFGGIPIVEFPNNHERISDIELVIDILDSINTMQSNRMDGIEQFVQSWIKFVNCEIDSEEFEKMKMNRALVVKSINKDNKSDVDVMTQELNQTECQVAKDDLWDNALSILAIPNKNNNNSGGDTQGAVQLRNGWDFSKTRAKLKDPLVKSAEKKLAKIILNIIRIKDHDLGITSRDFDVQINHSPQDNMYTKAQTLTVLLQCGIHPLVAIKTVGLWGDAEKTFILSDPYLKAKYQTIDDLEEQERKAKEITDQLNKDNPLDKEIKETVTE